MKDEEGRYSCDQCGRRCRDGGLQVVERGSIEAKRANRMPDAFYCSERCLRDRLMNIGQDEDPVEALQRQNNKLVDRMRIKDERIFEQDLKIDEFQGMLHTIGEERLADAIAKDERGDKLRRTLINLRVLLERR